MGQGLTDRSGRARLGCTTQVCQGVRVMSARTSIRGLEGRSPGGQGLVLKINKDRSERKICSTVLSI